MSSVEASRRRRSAWLQITLFAALVAGVVVAIADLVPGTGARLDHAAPGWIALGVLLELISCAAYGALFHGVFSHGAYRLGRLRAGILLTVRFPVSACFPKARSRPGAWFPPTSFLMGWWSPTRPAASSCSTGSPPV